MTGAGLIERGREGRWPMVSCVMPTRNARWSVSHAIWYFLNQDYAPRELIVVDDGDEAIADLLPRDPRLHYIHLAEPLSDGAKRNRGCQLATGELIVHWQDDAWYSPHRLRAQVAQFEDDAVQAAALTGLLHYQPLTGRLWRRGGTPPETVGVHPASLAYRRQYWSSHPFPERERDEITPFITAMSDAELSTLDGRELAVAVLHGTSTGVVNTADVRWQPRPFDELGDLLKLDLRLYTGLRSRRRRRRLAATPAPITVAATFMVYDGYGSMAEYLVRGMARSGADVRVAPLRIDATGMSEEFVELWHSAHPDPADIVLCYAWWGENIARFGAARDLFVKTMWETSSLPADWAARLNDATAVFVPSHFAARVFRQSGVTVPVEVVHLGADPEVYSFQERDRRNGLTTLVVGVLAARKNYRQAVDAWKLAFAGDPDARLILKARFQLEEYVPDDPRITVVDSNEPTRGILHWYRRADILLALGNEGFGLPLVEGMATGLPAVALDAEAQGDICDEAAGMLLAVPPASWEPVDSPLFGPCGVRAIPDVQVAAHQLRWIAEHLDEARAMGRRASAWAHARRNVWDLGPGTISAMERHARTARPLRRSNAIWVARSTSSGALGYYLDELLTALDGVRVVDAPPPVWRSATVHVQHVAGLFDEPALVAGLDAARDAGAAIVVTEHDVGHSAAPWEQLADVLVALDGAAAARLRERWPGKRVEIIPPGCPPWHPPTRDADGRTVVVVAAGDPDRALLDELRASARAEVAVLAPPRSSGELAARLNARADVALVLYDPARATASDQLVRSAIASGAAVVLAGASGAHTELAAAAVLTADPVAGVQEVLASTDRRHELAVAARVLCERTGWSQIAALHHALWRTLRT